MYKLNLTPSARQLRIDAYLNLLWKPPLKDRKSKLSKNLKYLRIEKASVSLDMSFSSPKRTIHFAFAAISGS